MEAAAAAEKAAKEAEEKKKEQARLRKEQDENEAVDDDDDVAPKKKRAKRTDTSRLIKATPREIAEAKGPGWKPPTKSTTGSTMDFPGDQWADQSKKKLTLLTTLRALWKDACLVPQPMTFNAVMDFIGADTGNIELDFNGRVFLYLLALILGQKRCDSVDQSCKHCPFVVSFTTCCLSLFVCLAALLIVS